RRLDTVRLARRAPMWEGGLPRGGDAGVQPALCPGRTPCAPAPPAGPWPRGRLRGTLSGGSRCRDREGLLMRYTGVLACLLVAPVLAGAADMKVKTETVTFAAGKDDKGSGYLVVPEGKGPFPAIVVIQEWYGVNDWVKDNAKRLAGQGYVCLAVDLY